MPLSWLCACEQAPTPATTSPHIAAQRKTSSEAKTPFRCAPLKKLRMVKYGFSARRAVFLLTMYVMALKETRMIGGYFYLGACSQGKRAAYHLIRTVSPTHTDVRVFMVFVKIKTQEFSRAPFKRTKAGLEQNRSRTSSEQKPDFKRTKSKLHLDKNQSETKMKPD